MNHSGFEAIEASNPDCNEIFNHFRKKGYQIISLGYFNSWADISLYKLTPFEWVNVFKYFSVCLTDTFHGSIFSAKAKIPFVTVDSDQTYNKYESKTLSLMKDLDLLNNYYNLLSEGNTTEGLIAKIERVQKQWSEEKQLLLDKKIKNIQISNDIFFRKIASLVKDLKK